MFQVVKPAKSIFLNFPTQIPNLRISVRDCITRNGGFLLVRGEVDECHCSQNFSQRLHHQKWWLLTRERRSGRLRSFYQLLTPTSQTMLMEHEKMLEQQGRLPGTEGAPHSFCNLAQHASWMGPTKFTHVPALLCSSKLWSIHKRRPPHPLELLEIQGYVVFETDDDNSDDADPWQCSFLKAIRLLSHHQIEHLAGNAMHLAAIGATLMLCMSCLDHQKTQQGLPASSGEGCQDGP